MDLDGVLAEAAMVLGDNAFSEELDRHLMPFEPDDEEAVDPARRVRSRCRAGGMASLVTRCTAAAAIRAKAQLEELVPDDPAAQADAVLGAIAGANAEPEPDVPPGRPAAKTTQNPHRAWTELITDLPTLLGLSTNPGYLLGYGPLDCDQARALAVPSRWRALVTISERAVAALIGLSSRPGTEVTRDDIVTALMNCIDHGDRVVLGEEDVGPSPPIKDPPTADGRGGWKCPPRGALKYRPGSKLARMVRALDGHCRHPECEKPAQDCEIDHIVPFNHADPMAGGWTIEANLGCLCKERHDLKTRGIISGRDAQRPRVLVRHPRRPTGRHHTGCAAAG